MPLKNGNWDLNINGTVGTLAIDAVGADGTLVGRLFEFVGGPELSIAGFWNEVAQSISFHTMIPDSGAVIIDPSTGQPLIDPNTGGAIPMPQPPSEFRSYRGYLFSTPPRPSPGQDITLTLTGEVQADASGGAANASPISASSRRNVFGWFAQMNEVI
ncbi:MAG TPA: hypothetical protein VFZ23_11460 [Pyrinomonadaceae bacterium]